MRAKEKLSCWLFLPGQSSRQLHQLTKTVCQFSGKKSGGDYRKLDKQVNSAYKIGFSQLQLLSKVKRFFVLIKADREKVVQAFLSSRLD